MAHAQRWSRAWSRTDAGGAFDHHASLQIEELPEDGLWPCRRDALAELSPEQLSAFQRRAEEQAHACLFAVQCLADLVAEALEESIGENQRIALLGSVLTISEQARKMQRWQHSAEYAMQLLRRKAGETPRGRP